MPHSCKRPVGPRSTTATGDPLHHLTGEVGDQGGSPPSVPESAAAVLDGPVLSGRLSLERFIALGELDPRLLPACPYVPCGPQPGRIVQRAAPDPRPFLGMPQIHEPHSGQTSLM